jgi:glycosidase
MVMLSAVAARPAPLNPPAETWWHDAVFYEVFVRSFADSADGPLANDGVGDFRGLTARLDYLNDGDPATTTDLGVDALWLMPIAESPSYHGYDVTDYRAVDSEYGTAADFRAFTDAAHERGVRVIVDLVLNHCSSRHPWFLEAAADPASPKRDWFVWSDERPDYRGPWGQQVWHPVSRGSGGPFYYGCFSRGMPDLNLENPDVTAELKEVARFWIEDMGVDGFRLDAIKHLIEDGQTQENTRATIDWLEDFQAYCKSLDPDFFTVGEVWSSTEQVQRYIPDAVDTAFEFDLAGDIINALNTGDASELEARLKTVRDAYDTPAATFLTNHDQPRLMTQLGGHPGKARAAAALLLTLPGVPFIYYGEEIGHTGDKPDPNIRTPMQWDATGAAFSAADPWRAAQPDQPETNLAAQRNDHASLFRHYQTLIRLRRQYDALRGGRVNVLRTTDPRVLALTRRTEREHVLVILNTSGETTGRFTVELDRPAETGFVGLRDAFDRSAPGVPGSIGRDGRHVFAANYGPYRFEILILPETETDADPFAGWPMPE